MKFTTAKLKNATSKRCSFIVSPSHMTVCGDPLTATRIVDVDASEYEQNFTEQHVRHSNALHSVLRGHDSYTVGPWRVLI